jgi:hypothetical protein
MAYYNYKIVRDQLPSWIIEAQGPDYEGDGNYDGDQWCAAAAYISFLEGRVLESGGNLFPSDKDRENASY